MSTTTLKGSCLCGAVTFALSGQVTRFYHCHCKRCRKATGTGHATNLFLQPGTLNWLSGQEHIKAFKVPEARHFTNQFCANCGGRLPRQPQGSDMVVIPAGSLDDETSARPQARIFVNSASSWSCLGDNLPTFPEMPPR